MTLYAIKPGFQRVVRPLARCLAAGGITANQVTLATAAFSVVTGAVVGSLGPAVPSAYLLIPGWLLLRMALNAVDGILAREFGQQSRLGAYLNELGDVVSDAALYLPFALIAPFSLPAIAGLLFLAALTEFAGVMGPSVGAARRHDGPLGKSDRALVFGALGLWIGVTGALPGWLFWLVPLLSALSLLTIANRVRCALQPLPPTGELRS